DRAVGPVAVCAAGRRDKLALRSAIRRCTRARLPVCTTAALACSFLPSDRFARLRGACLDLLDQSYRPAGLLLGDLGIPRGFRRDSDRVRGTASACILGRATFPDAPDTQPERD